MSNRGGYETGFSLFRGVLGATVVKAGFGELALSNRGGLTNMDYRPTYLSSPFHAVRFLWAGFLEATRINFGAGFECESNARRLR